VCVCVCVPGVPVEVLAPEVDVDECAVDGVDDHAEEDCDEVLDEGIAEAVLSPGAVHPDHTEHATVTLLVSAFNPHV